MSLKTEACSYIPCPHCDGTIRILHAQYWHLMRDGWWGQIGPNFAGIISPDYCSWR